MDPNSGRLFTDLATARLNGVENPVEVSANRGLALAEQHIAEAKAAAGIGVA
jgi:hypothetical protein